MSTEAFQSGYQTGKQEKINIYRRANSYIANWWQHRGEAFSEEKNEKSRQFSRPKGEDEWGILLHRYDFLSPLPNRMVDGRGVGWGKEEQCASLKMKPNRYFTMYQTLSHLTFSVAPCGRFQYCTQYHTSPCVMWLCCTSHWWENVLSYLNNIGFG